MMMFYCVVFVMSCCRVTYIALATRAFMPSDEGFYAKATMSFMPNVPNYGQSDGYHMHNIVVSHGVGYVYF